MKTILRLSRLSLMVLLVSCGQDLVENGTEGGSCRLTPTPCNETLRCVAGKCRVDESSSSPNLEIVADLSKRTMLADGEDELDLQLLVNLSENGEAFSGDLLLYAEPAGVGTLSASLIRIEDGFGAATYQSCNRRNDGICPEVISFKLAQPDSPNEPIFETETIRQLSTPIESPTRLQTDLCRSTVGSRVGLIIPTENNERVESSDADSWLNQADSLLIDTQSARLRVTIPDQRVNSYHALSPGMVQVLITTAIDTMQETDGDAEAEAMLSSCLADGIWVGHQMLEFWTEEDSEQNNTSHILSILELDCFDDRNGYAVIRACTHGTQ